eukprot:1895423-Rhodomonas_salina.2
MLLVRPNFRASSWICVASSRVGASASSVGPWREFLCMLLMMWRKPGKRKPSVFPDPVLATPTTSRPCSAGGQA